MSRHVPIREVLGWSRGIDSRFGDETGIWHLVVTLDDAPSQARAACDGRRRVAGQVEKLDGHPCKRCLSISRRVA